jgi:predicted RNA-binding protein
MVVIKNNFFIYLSNLIREEINKKLIENKDKLPIFSLLVDDKVIEGKIVKIDPEECEFEIEAEDNKKHLIPWNKIKEFFGIKHAN